MKTLVFAQTGNQLLMRGTMKTKNNMDSCFNETVDLDADSVAPGSFRDTDHATVCCYSAMVYHTCLDEKTKRKKKSYYLSNHVVENGDLIKKKPAMYVG